VKKISQKNLGFEENKVVLPDDRIDKNCQKFWVFVCGVRANIGLTQPHEPLFL
jgi:hypothetical protein